MASLSVFRRRFALPDVGLSAANVNPSKAVADHYPVSHGIRRRIEVTNVEDLGI